MDERSTVEEFGRLIDWLKAETAAIRAQAEEVVRESQSLQVESRQLAEELREIRARRHLRIP
jgi:regulator of replication initiation timing